MRPLGRWPNVLDKCELRAKHKVAEALTSGAGDAAGRLTAAVEQLRDHFGEAHRRSGWQPGTAGSQFAQQAEWRDRSTQAAEAAASALRTGGQSARHCA